MDTRSKRASSAGLLLAFLLHPVLPDGTLGQGDRQHIAATYSGILAGAPAATVYLTATATDASVTSATATDASVTTATSTDVSVTSATATDALAS